MRDTCVDDVPVAEWVKQQFAEIGGRPEEGLQDDFALWGACVMSLRVVCDDKFGIKCIPLDTKMVTIGQVVLLVERHLAEKEVVQ